MLVRVRTYVIQHTHAHCCTCSSARVVLRHSIASIISSVDLGLFPSRSMAVRACFVTPPDFIMHPSIHSRGDFRRNRAALDRVHHVLRIQLIFAGSSARRLRVVRVGRIQFHIN